MSPGYSIELYPVLNFFAVDVVGLQSAIAMIHCALFSACLEQLVIFGVRAYPKPDRSLWTINSQSAILNTDSD